MALMFPKELPYEIRSSKKHDAEKILFDVLKRRLNNEWIVLYNQTWIQKTNPFSENLRDGETDFIVCHPKYGLLVIEVKGGLEVYQDSTTSSWYSKSKNGQLYEIHNPFDQVRRNKYALIETLKNRSELSPFRVKELTVGAAVCFPEFDANYGRNVFLDDANIVLMKKDLAIIQQKIIEILERITDVSNVKEEVNRKVFDFLKSSFNNPQRFGARLKSWIESEDKQIYEATEEQYDILDNLSGNNLVHIKGVAGSGKTLLAIHHAVTCSASGKKVLLVCYNSLLGQSFSNFARNNQNLLADNYHNMINRVARLNGIQPCSNVEDRILDYVVNGFVELFDVLIIDEAQDFDENQIGLSRLLVKENGKHVVFSDSNQNVHFKSNNTFNGFTNFTLTKNLRNTKYIFDEVKKYYYQDYPLKHKGPLGRPVVTDISYVKGNSDDMKSKLRSVINKLIIEEGLEASDLTVLTAKSVESSCLSDLSVKSINLNIFSNYEIENSVRVETIRRFKGLEGKVIIVTELDDVEELEDETKRNLMYVAYSRAKHHLIILNPL